MEGRKVYRKEGRSRKEGHRKEERSQKERKVGRNLQKEHKKAIQRRNIRRKKGTQ